MEFEYSQINDNIINIDDSYISFANLTDGAIIDGAIIDGAIIDGGFVTYEDSQISDGGFVTYEDEEEFSNIDDSYISFDNLTDGGFVTYEEHDETNLMNGGFVDIDSDYYESDTDIDSSELGAVGGGAIYNYEIGATPIYDLSAYTVSGGAEYIDDDEMDDIIGGALDDYDREYKLDYPDVDIVGGAVGVYHSNNNKRTSMVEVAKEITDYLNTITLNIV